MVTQYEFDVGEMKLTKASFFKLGSQGTKDFFRARFNFNSGPWVPENTIAVFTSTEKNLRVEVELTSEGVCRIPNDIVRDSGDFHVFLYSSTIDDETGKTKFRIITNTVTIYLYSNNVPQS